MTVSLCDLTLEVAQRRLLAGVDLTLPPGECVAIMGPSGVGKTSLLNCVAGITTPASGSVVVDGVELSALPAARRSAFRLRRIGMVFQFAELLPELTVCENVALPSRLMGVARDVAGDRAMAQLSRVGLADRADSHPHELSGGEQQRVGLARALAHEPVLLLADEPTGMLDEDSTGRVTDLLLRASHDLGVTTVIATHDSEVAARADRTFVMGGGTLSVADGLSATSGRSPAVTPSP